MYSSHSTNMGLRPLAVQAAEKNNYSGLLTQQSSEDALHDPNSGVLP